jgi:hypothetical protein
LALVHKDDCTRPESAVKRAEKEKFMSTLTSEYVTEELDAEFDLDIRIDEPDPTGSDLTPEAIQTVSTSCTGCCTGNCYSVPASLCRPY